MAQIRFNYLFAVASLLLLVAAQSPPVEARKFIGVNQWCHTAYYRRLCTRMVHGAVTKNEAALNALQTTLEYAKRLEGMIDMVKPSIARLSPKTQESIMSTCTEDLSGNIDDIEKSIASVQNNDLGTVYSHLSASLSSDCVDALTQFHVTTPLTKYARLLHNEVDSCMAILTQT